MPSTVDLAARLSAIVELQQQILSAVHLSSELNSVIVNRAPEVCGGTGAVIELVDGTDLVYNAASGTAARRVGLRLPMAASLSGLTVREDTMIRTNDVELDPRADIAACRDIGIRSMIVAPLTRKGGALGVLKVFSGVPNAFDDLDAYCVQLLAGITAAALQQAEIFSEQQASEARYRMLFEKNVAGVFRARLGGQILDCNDALVGFLGYDSRNDLLQHLSWELYKHHADRENMLAELAEGHSVMNLRVPFVKKDGSEFMAVLNVGLIGGGQAEPQVLGTLVEE